MTFTAFLEMRLVPETVDAALPVIHEMLKGTRSFPGNVGLDVWIDKDDPAHLILIETWESEEADTAYRLWRREGAGAAPEVAQFVAAKPVLTFVSLSEV
ncbi:hypothetical protein BH09ACT10_BH09ACT10_20100 [soil metagenome]